MNSQAFQSDAFQSNAFQFANSNRDGASQSQSMSDGTDCCCNTGTGTGGCECDCCPLGYWTEYTFTITGMETALNPFNVCAGYDGTWVLKYRGNRSFGGFDYCVWSTDDVTDGSLCEGDTALHPFEFPGGFPERWILYCLNGFWTLINAATTVKWVFDSTGTSVDFCLDGGLMLYSFEDTSACCKWNGFAVSPTETNYLTVEPTGIFVPC